MPLITLGPNRLLPTPVVPTTLDGGPALCRPWAGCDLCDLISPHSCLQARCIDREAEAGTPRRGYTADGAELAGPSVPAGLTQAISGPRHHMNSVICKRSGVALTGKCQEAIKSLLTVYGAAARQHLAPLPPPAHTRPRGGPRRLVADSQPPAGFYETGYGQEGTGDAGHQGEGCFPPGRRQRDTCRGAWQDSPCPLPGQCSPPTGASEGWGIAREGRRLSLHPGFATDMQWDLGQITLPLWASVSPSLVQEGWSRAVVLDPY